MSEREYEYKPSAESEAKTESKSESEPEKPKPKVVSVVVFKDKGGEWRWKGLAGNGKVVADSGEGYRNRPYARQAALAMFPEAKVIWGDK